MTASRDDLLARAVGAFSAVGAVAVHLFGSLARGDGDDLSDIDLWVTVPDDQIERLIERRFELFHDNAEVVISHEAPRNRPLGGSYTLVIHRVGEALIQADYYLAPESTSVILPEARLLAGSDLLPRGQWVLDTTAEVVEDLHERIDFLICMSFIGIKKALREDQDFLVFLHREFERFGAAYGLGDGLSIALGSIERLKCGLEGLLPASTSAQAEAISAVIGACSRQVHLANEE